MRRVTTLVLEIAFSATGVDGGHIIWKRILSVNDWSLSVIKVSIYILMRDREGLAVNKRPPIQLTTTIQYTIQYTVYSNVVFTANKWKC